jgi:PhnB protein
MEAQRSNRALSLVPEGYHTVNPWVIPKGATDFIQFLEKVFEAKEEMAARTLDDDGLLIHAEVKIGDSVIGVFDSKADWPPTPSFLQVYVEDAEVVLQRAKEAGAEVVTELSDFVYGEKLARFRDPWGNLWWINQRIEEVEWEAEAKRLEHLLATTQESNYIKETLMQAMKLYA